MQKIRFSHKYLKFPFDYNENNRAVLLSVRRVKLEKLPKDFIDVDTAYSMDNGAETGYYQLPEKGDYLLLLLWANTGLFTTLRSYNPAKQAYYEKLEGETLEVVIDAPL
jgi:hypothetical protein